MGIKTGKLTLDVAQLMVNKDNVVAKLTGGVARSAVVIPAPPSWRWYSSARPKFVHTENVISTANTPANTAAGPRDHRFPGRSTSDHDEQPDHREQDHRREQVREVPLGDVADGEGHQRGREATEHGRPQPRRCWRPRRSGGPVRRATTPTSASAQSSGHRGRQARCEVDGVEPHVADTIAGGGNVTHGNRCHGRIASGRKYWKIVVGRNLTPKRLPPFAASVAAATRSSREDLLVERECVEAPELRPVDGRVEHDGHSQRDAERHDEGAVDTDSGSRPTSEYGGSAKPEAEARARRPGPRRQTRATGTRPS